MSCSACQKIFTSRVLITPRNIDDTNEDASRYFQTHHVDLSELCRAALAGCRICSDLWRHFFKQKTPKQYAVAPWFDNEGPKAAARHLYIQSGTTVRYLEAPERSAGRSEYEPGAFLMEFKLNSPMVRDLKDFIYILHETKDRGLLNERMELVKRSQLEETAAGPMRLLGYQESMFERKRWDQVHDWVSTCSSTHSVCNARRSAVGFLPRRVLYAPYGPLPPEPRFLLFDTSMQDVVALGAGYLTLSHTWGANKNPAYSTRKHNVSERIEHGIAWRDLPLTFQNTIDAARRLRVPLIWIDNLCIVQDDSKEWVVESAKMGDIYKNSYLNISATSAKSSQEGLTSSLELHPRLLQTDWNGDRQAGCYRIMERSFWVDRISEASINTRGWVLQERVLASRILHYCYDQLAWECCELSASEQFPGGLPPPLQDTHGSFKQDVKIGLLTSFPNESSDEVTRRDAFVTWQTVVHMYGNCELSKPDQDKFVAISGLASAVQKQLNGDEYLAGIWRSNIYAGLLWKVFKERRHINEYTVDAGMYSKKYGTSARSSDYRAPSWSWASVDGILRLWRYFDMSGQPMDLSDEMGKGTTVCITPRALILEASTTPRDASSPLGQVESGRLLVQGRLYRLGFKDLGYNSGGMAIFASTGESVFPSFDEPVYHSSYDEAYFLPLVLRMFSFGEKTRSLQETEASLLSTLSMPLPGMEPSSEGDWTSAEERHKADLAALKKNSFHDQVFGIVLCPTKDRRAFCRIGMVETSKRLVDRLDETATIPYWEEEPARSRADVICTPSTALGAGGDVVVGSFEIL